MFIFGGYWFGIWLKLACWFELSLTILLKCAGYSPTVKNTVQQRWNCTTLLSCLPWKYPIQI